MNAHVDISVIIPCFNSLLFVGDAIDSVFQSTISSFEILVVDDGSQEPVEPYLRARYPNAENLKCIRQENRGLSGARNTGIREAAGEFLVFLDADDLILPEKLNIQLQYLRANPAADIVYSMSEWFKENDPDHSFSVQFPIYEGDILTNLLYGNFIHVNSVMIPKKLVVEAGAFDESFKELEDWDLWLRLAIKSKNFACIRTILSKVRVHATSMTSNQLRMNNAMVRVMLKNKSGILTRHSSRNSIKICYYDALLQFCLLAKQKKTGWKFLLEAFRITGIGFSPKGLKFLLKWLRSLVYSPVNQTTKELEHVWNASGTKG